MCACALDSSDDNDNNRKKTTFGILPLNDRKSKIPAKLCPDDSSLSFYLDFTISQFFIFGPKH